MAVNVTTLFTELGHIFGTAAATNVAALTTLPAEYTNILGDFASLTAPYQAILNQILAAESSAQSGLDGTTSTLGQQAQALLIQTVNDDTPMSQPTLANALAILLAQMAGNDYVSANTPALAGASAGSANIGSDLTIVSSVKDGSGFSLQNLLAETITLTLQDSSGTVQSNSRPTVSNPMGYLWPGGSGTNQSLSPATLGTSVLGANGGFDSANPLDANLPVNWIAVTATPGTTVTLSTIAQQTVTIAGTPTAGYYYLIYTNSASKTQQTGAIPYNAGGSQVQQALNQLTGLGSVTVSSTGTTPNFTHTVTFTGVPGAVTTLTAVDDTTGGTHSVTLASTVGGTPAYNGLAMYLTGNGGGENTSLVLPVTLQPLTQYALCYWARYDSSSLAAGVLEFALIDGTTNSHIDDAQGVDTAATLSHSALTTSFVAHTAVFRTPANLPPITYLRIKATTALTSGHSIYLDEMRLQVMQQIVSGGAFLAAFPGIEATGAAPCVPGDTYTIAATNTLSNSGAAGFQSWFERAFSMRQLGLILPTSGGSLQNDSLIA